MVTSLRSRPPLPSASGSTVALYLVADLASNHDIGHDDDEHLVERQHLHRALARPRGADGRALDADVVELAVARLQVLVRKLVARVVDALGEHDAVRSPVGDALLEQLGVQEREGHLVAKVARHAKGLRAVLVHRPAALGLYTCGRLFTVPWSSSVRGALALEEGPKVARKDALVVLEGLPAHPSPRGPSAWRGRGSTSACRRG